MRFLGFLGAALATHFAVMALVGDWVGSRPDDPPPTPWEFAEVELSLSERDEVSDNVGESAASSAVEATAEVPPPDPPLPELRNSESAALSVPEPPVNAAPPKALPYAQVQAVPSELEAADEPMATDSKPVRDTARVDVPPRPGTEIRPVYPRGCRRRGEEGVVTLEIAVSASGRVESASVASSSGHAELDAAALSAVRKAVFAPATSEGRAVSGKVRLPIAFRLSAIQ